MAILKLQNAGESLTMTVKQAEVTAGKFGAQVKFENTDGDVLFVSQQTAERQLSRIPLAVEDCAGETLVFSRDENKGGGAPYWGIRLAGAADKAPPSRRMDSPYQAPSIGKPIKGLDDFPDEEYGASVHSPDGVNPNDAYANPGPLPPFHKPPTKAAATAPTAVDRMKVAREYLDLLAWVKAELPKLDDSAAQAAAATIYIAWGKKGLA